MRDEKGEIKRLDEQKDLAKGEPDVNHYDRLWSEQRRLKVRLF